MVRRVGLKTVKQAVMTRVFWIYVQDHLKELLFVRRGLWTRCVELDKPVHNC